VLKTISVFRVFTLFNLHNRARSFISLSKNLVLRS
jgi:hypothetical protein